MKINYIILAHEKPKQVNRLVRKLTTKNASFYIHVDKRVNIDDFENEMKGLQNVYFLKGDQRRNIIWGDIEIIIAILNALRLITKDNKKGYCVLLSGQDYPLKPPGYIESFFEKNYGINYITCWNFPIRKWNDGGYYRLKEYKFNVSSKKKSFYIIPSFKERKAYTFRSLAKALLLICRFRFKSFVTLVHKREFPKDLIPYGGSQWWGASYRKCKTYFSIYIRPSAVSRISQVYFGT